MKKQMLLLLVLILCALTLAGCSCKHDETEIINAVSASCLEDGYTGDVRCLNCKEIVTQGETVPAIGHQISGPIDAKEPECYYDGSTGYYECSVCGLMMQEAEIIPAQHGRAVQQPGYDPTCTKAGYTGNQVCNICSNILIRGEEIPPLGHGELVIRDAVEPTCTERGYTGDQYCTVCEKLVVKGEQMPTAEHTLTVVGGVRETTCLVEGYTGDQVCEVCGAEVRGEVFPRLDHVFENRLCTLCGWKEPGLYQDDQLVMSWEELEEYGYVTVDRGELKSVQGNFAGGCLVIGEDVTSFRSLDGAAISALWIPRSVTRLEPLGYKLTHRTDVEEVVLYCQVDRISGEAFMNTKTLKRVVLPESLRGIGNSAFRDCVNLEEINLPDSITEIGMGAFEGCTALKELRLPANLKKIGSSAFENLLITRIDLPDGVETIEYGAFSACENLTSITLPPALKSVASSIFDGCSSLKTADMSACVNLKRLGRSMFRDCGALETLLLPPNLEYIDESLFGDDGDVIPLKELAFPEGFRSITGEKFRCVHLSKVVWPVSLVEAGTLVNCPLEEILYRGPEARWKMVSGIEAFENVKITFDYAD